MHLDRLRPVCESDGPFATVVLDTTHDTEDADDQDRLRWRALRDRLADQGAPNDVLTRLDDAVTDAPTAVGPAGRVLVADPQQVLVDLRTRGRPTAEAASWGVVADLSAVVGQWAATRGSRRAVWRRSWRRVGRPPSRSCSSPRRPSGSVRCGSGPSRGRSA
ncbi:hypothetical protein [Pseudonocardia sp. WMMC193]|uniref:hypothetical protein n=1 Tax=Pseudonocardia sp. WMMC193 TaxID=2911965 RepID=UPI001F17F2D3|nr:hypothetical protein [Pseudonocardia sp. WMMC193]MCF7553509.1 hypothetical protein [Pseudonocardia sp. WMMC193]